MRNVAVFCDGTWNSLDATERTNVAILADSVPKVAADGTEQVALYVPGVGTGPGKARWLDRQIDRLGGGAFGWGLDARLQAAYTDIAKVYRPGDRLFLFGFSRGAYTARSLVGLLRNCGLPDDEATRNRIPEAMTLYRNRDPSSHPDAPGSLEFRAGFSPRFATSETDRLTRPGPVSMLSVDFLGVWDTVGALGVPDQFWFLAKLFNGKYKFHDLRLSSMVKAARHAVAIDERRRTFPPTLWENLGELNKPKQVKRYVQEWFPGTHGGVGGGGPIRGLSSATLLWMMEGAEEAGMRFSTKVKDRAKAELNIAAPLDNQPAGPKGFFERLLAEDVADRAPPGSMEAISWVARDRWRLHGYRPVPLRPFAPRMDPPVMPQDWPKG